MISFTTTGSFKRTERFLTYIGRGDLFRQLETLAQKGVSALQAATPIESGLAASSWGYEIKGGNSPTIVWTNSDVENGFPVAIMIQYGHGTGTGGYVSGRDYINPAMRPVFDEIADSVWKAVTSA